VIGRTAQDHLVFSAGKKREVHEIDSCNEGCDLVPTSIWHRSSMGLCNTRHHCRDRSSDDLRESRQDGPWNSHSTTTSRNRPRLGGPYPTAVKAAHLENTFTGLLYVCLIAHQK
jgi:hypothetical protein